MVSVIPIDYQSMFNTACQTGDLSLAQFISTKFTIELDFNNNEPINVIFLIDTGIIVKLTLC